ncbi:MAG: ABC transporter permease [Oscillospiraceae bacterium]|nr:ABC transporter permease [Oscillospiraceae bacterium]
MKKGNLFLYIGGAISILMTALIVMGYFWTPYSPTAMSASEKFDAPSFAHIMGTDNFGRDIFSRVIDGAGTTFFIAVCVVAIGCVTGIIIGSLCGYYGGMPDLVLTRVCDSITAFPSFLLALVIVTVMGSGKYNIIVALGILFVPSFARVVRGEFARCRELNYVKSARLMGVGDFRIMFRHILPNIYPVLFSTITIGFNNAVLSEASMSFLGIGIQPPDASLGSMLSDSQSYLRSAPWYAFGTGAVIILLILGFSLLSEGLQRANRDD